MATTPRKAAARKTPKKAAPAAEGRVDAFMRVLVHPLHADIEAVRKIVLGADASISDGVKWNSLSFRRSDWFATVNLRSKDAVQLVFHTGAKVKDTPELKIPDPAGLMLWVAKDRALVTLGSGKTLKANAKAFEAIVKAWLKYV
jgi:hypothetical protein